MNKYDLIEQVLNNGRPERVPVGFWFHFVEDPAADGFKNPAIFDENIAGHRKFVEEFDPDFVKIMTDGFFIYPNRRFYAARSAAELGQVEPIGAGHEWIEKQVEFAKKARDVIGGSTPCFYNIFAPATLFRFGRGEADLKALADFIVEDGDAVARGLDAVARDLASLAERVLDEAGVDGVYYSVQDIADSRIGDEARKKSFDAANFTALKAANGKSSRNILHICGYDGFRNDLSRFADYPAQIFNWATAVEGTPLGAGKKLFNGKPVIGGFGNTVKEVLYRGNRAEIEAATAAILEESGFNGVALGADCTLPPDINLDRLRWVRDKAAELSARR
ncbi:MAG: uroporphyrinogen decarboxylase [Spirochaetaceae bacterium]|jgi:uroporphyrinogen decarboxylase|nr:uroporphyrinogen decarboxylase [Spirochaetaceae bacterium]